MNPFYKFLMPFIILLVTILPAFGFGTADNHSHAAPELGRDLAIKLQVPLFSEFFSNMPVASLGKQPIRLGEIVTNINQESDTKIPQEELSRLFQKALQQQLEKHQDEPGTLALYADARISANHTLLVHAPLFAKHFEDVPVALVNEVPVTIAEFARDLQAVHDAVSEASGASGASTNINRLLDRMVTVRLVEQEARNIGFDETKSFRQKVMEFAEKTLLFALLNKQVETLPLDMAAVDELYRKISLQGTFHSYRFDRQEDAVALRDALDQGGDFNTLIAAAVKSGKASAEEQQGAIKFRELLANIAVEASKLEIGGISQIFRKADGFLIFKLVDRQFVEDEKALDFARKNVWERQTATAGSAYMTKLVDQYARFDEDARKSLDFNQLKANNPSITLDEALRDAEDDQRILVRIEGAEPGSITVAEVALKIRETYFHGTDIPLNVAEVELKRDEILEDALFRMAGLLEARKLDLDQAPSYLREVAEFERRTLFDLFMQKAVTPDIQVSEDEVRAYYDKNMTRYQTPAMFKIRSLPFYRAQDAGTAADKLRHGSDFKWVSANADGLANIQDENLLEFDRNILSLTALPTDLQPQLKEIRQGDTLVYTDPGNFSYVLYFDEVYAPEPRPYDQVRKEILAIVYQEKTKETLEEWVGQLKKAYPTEVFLVTNSQ